MTNAFPKNDLARPFPVKKIHWRVGATTKDKSKGIALAYLDARDVMHRLDDVFGQYWQCRYPFAGCCEIGVFWEDQWIWRSNGAGETDIEGEKGQFSDSFKRAAVMWGVGRYLYALPNVWMPLDEYKRLTMVPELPEWATPEGFELIMEKRNG